MMARRELLAVAAVIDVALHSRGKPVAAKTLAARHDLAPRQLETLLRDLVRGGILKGTRGPQGGYELARERRRISLGAIVRACDKPAEASAAGPHPSTLIDAVVRPAVEEAWAVFLDKLDAISIESLVDRARTSTAGRQVADVGGFVI